MEANKRRDKLVKLLEMNVKPMSATSLGGHFSVSRQVIVGDIALLRAGGLEVSSTPRGYVISKKDEAGMADSYVISCRHDASSLSAELYIIVDNGGEMLSVSVDHQIFGTITQPMNIRSRFDADDFVNKVAASGALLLCSLSQGVHMHTVRCQNPESYRRILIALKEYGILHT